jgi:hypothetical protein
MAENDGSIAISLSLEIDRLKQSVTEAQAVIKKLTTDFRKNGEQAGKVYVEGVGEGVNELNRRLNKFVDSMSSISPKMGKIGEKIASGFSKPLLSAIPKIATAFSTMLPIVALIGAAIAVVGKVVGEVAEKHKEHVKEINASREAAERLNGTYKETNKTFAEQLTVWEKIKTAFATAFTANHPAITDIRDIYKEQAKIIAGARIMKKVNDDINNGEAAYKQKLDEIRTAQAAGLMDEREANIERLEANKALTEELIKQLEIAKDTATDADEIGRIEARLSLLKQERDVLTDIAAIDRGNTSPLIKPVSQSRRDIHECQSPLTNRRRCVNPLAGLPAGGRQRGRF